MKNVVMMGLAGLEVSAQEKTLLENEMIGGVILFDRNYQNSEQVAKYIDIIQQIRQVKQLTPVLLAVDQEGGQIQRFNDDGFCALPAMAVLGGLYKKDAEKAKQVSRQCGWLMAAELRAANVDLSFAPILDVDGGNAVISGKGRAFHAEPKVVAELAGAFCQGMLQAGLQPVGKHFPGHGVVEVDSHISLPIDAREQTQIREHDFIPFQQLIEKKLVAGIMPAHVLYEKFDEKFPTTFSDFWLQTILRGEMQFDGLIFSDAIEMGAAAEFDASYSKRVTLALEKGCDMVLMCEDHKHDYKNLDEILQTLEQFSVPAEQEQQRLARFKRIFPTGKPFTFSELENLPEYQQAKQVMDELVSEKVKLV